MQQTVLTKLLLALGLIAGLQALPAQAQGSDQCGQYVTAYRSGPSAYGPYLQAAEVVAQQRDAQEGSRRYVTAFKASSVDANALWLNNWCTQNPLQRISEASSRLLDELTGQSAARGTAPAQVAQPPQQAQPAPPVIIVAPPPRPLSSCRVGDTKACAGCAITCERPNQRATCKPGTDSVPGADRCVFKADCSCF